MSLDCGRNPDDSEKTHTSTDRTCKLHIERNLVYQWSGPGSQVHGSFYSECCNVSALQTTVCKMDTWTQSAVMSGPLLGSKGAALSFCSAVHLKCKHVQNICMYSLTTTYLKIKLNVYYMQCKDTTDEQLMLKDFCFISNIHLQGFEDKKKF